MSRRLFPYSRLSWSAVPWWFWGARITSQSTVQCARVYITRSPCRSGFSLLDLVYQLNHINGIDGSSVAIIPLFFFRLACWSIFVFDQCSESSSSTCFRYALTKTPVISSPQPGRDNMRRFRDFDESNIEIAIFWEVLEKWSVFGKNSTLWARKLSGKFTKSR